MTIPDTDFSNLPSDIDVDAEARIIQSLAADTVATILNRRRTMDAAGQAHEPLLVALGEGHSIPAHKAWQLLIIHLLRQAGESCLMAFERPHDLLLQTYKTEGGFVRSPASNTLLTTLDEQGQLNLQSSMAFMGSHKSDHMYKILMNYCRRTGTPADFTDAPYNEDWILNKQYPSTRASIEHCLDPAALAPEYDLSAVSSNGIYVRNHHMLTTAREAAQKNNGRIILQQTGNEHIAGNVSDLPAEQSLLGLSRSFNFTALGFISSHRGFSRAHIDAVASRSCGAADDLHWRKGLPERRAIYHPLTDTPQHTIADMQFRAAEAAYAAAILSRLGLGEYALSVHEYWERRAADQSAMYEIFADIDALARQRPAAQPA